MYRIKTDIRQYKCDTKEKVEKLIRNWVIRPNDLIYEAEQQRWSPIGEHPSFVSLFSILEAQERAEPDTVVTATPQKPEEQPATVEVEQPLAPPEEPLGLTPEVEVNDEVTRIKQRPVIADSEAEDSALETPAEPPASEEPTVEREPEGDPRKTDIMDSPLEMPKAPAGVEHPAPPDEVTMMTERTLDLLKVTDEVSSLSKPEETPAETPEDPAQNDETLDLASSPSVAEEIAAATATENPLGAAKPKLGRHDLPEDFFATNELSGPIDRESLRDDLAALAPGSAANADEKPVAASEPDSHEDGDDDEWKDDHTPTHVGLEDTSAPDDLEIHNDDTPEPSPVVQDGDADEDDWDDYDDLDEVEFTPHVVEKHSDRVADVYNIPLPFEIVPSEEDIAVGIKRNNAPKSVKDKAFPPPEEKKFKDAQLHTFDFSKEPPVDRSMTFVVGIVLALMFIVAVIALT